MTLQEVLFKSFVKNGSLFLIIPIIKEVVAETDLAIFLEDRRLLLKEKIIKDKYEPISIYVYDLDSKDACGVTAVEKQRFRIRFREKEIFDIEAEVCNDKDRKKYDLTITTLFKNDYRLFNIFYDYYCRQGVEYFYMYYNGIADDMIKQVLEKPNAKLIDWNYRYFNDRGAKYIHNAQMGQIHHALHCYGDTTEYMIFCDLDEYLEVTSEKHEGSQEENSKNNTLLKYVSSKPDIEIFGFLNKWSKTIDMKIPKEFPTEFYASTSFYFFGNRSKIIAKTDSCQLLNIHYHHQPCNKLLVDKRHVMYHFFNWSDSSRLVNENFILVQKPL